MEAYYIGEKKSRHRGENWTQEEKALLLKVMRHSIPIIESKLTDTNSNRRKYYEWIKVQKKYQELSGKRRNITQLKGIWRRIKVIAKKKGHEPRKENKNIERNRQPLTPSGDCQLLMDLRPTDLITDRHEYDSSDEISLSQIGESGETTRRIKDLEINSVINDSIYEKIVKEESDPLIQEAIGNDDMNSKDSMSPNGEPEETTTINNVRNVSIYEKIVREESNPLIEEAIKNHDINSKDSMQHTEIISDEENIDYIETTTRENNKKYKAKLNHRTIRDANVDLRKKQMHFMEEEYSMKIMYQRKELLHQELKHKLELNILLLEKEKKELEIRVLKKSLEKH